MGAEKNNLKTSETFSYTYSSRQQEEILTIQQKFLPPVEDKMERLRKLDRQANLPGTLAAVFVGLMGVLLLGLGLCCVLLESWRAYFAQGIVLGCVGLLLMASAMPINKRLTAYMHKKMAPQVLALTEELLHQ